jgi:hypothetical protein
MIIKKCHYFVEKYIGTDGLAKLMIIKIFDLKKNIHGLKNSQGDD